jgi:hypothetical protein
MRMNKESLHFGSDFKIISMSIIYKMQIIVIENDFKGLIRETATYYAFELGEFFSKSVPNLSLVCTFLLLSNESTLHKYV